MIAGKRVLAIIPARAGSKRLPGKNTKLLGGAPLIQWSIEAARACFEIDTTVVTSDDPAALVIAKAEGVETVIRPPEMATDQAPTAPALRHALLAMEKLCRHPFGLVVLLQPTSPLRQSKHIADGLYRLSFALPTGCYSAYTVGPDNQPNGAVYISDRQIILAGHVISQHSLTYKIPEECAVDIDTLEDFQRAESLLQEARSWS